MNTVFESVLSASLSGGVIIVLILILRLVLKKAPRRYICLLWLLAAVRLMIPLNIESSLSLQPDVGQLLEQRQEETVPEELADPVPAIPGVTENASTPVTGSPAVIPDDVVISTGDALSGGDATVSVFDWTVATPGIWAAVTFGFLVYTLISYMVLKRKVRGAVRLDGNVYECSAISSPFLLGYIRPRIYLPVGLPPGDMEHILAHERAHVRRLDHWTKLFLFLCLAVHWFNPLVWAAYILLCKDMEMACDEAVIREMPLERRKAYSRALVNCAANMRMVSACPVAFGEVSVKQRILKVLNYRRPVFWISLVCVAAIVFVAVCFLTDPAPDKAELLEQCRSALEEFQSTGCYHISNITETRSVSWLVLDDPDGYEEWNGSDREYLLITTNGERAMHRLHLGGQYLQRDIVYSTDGETVDSGWYSNDWSGSSFFSTHTIADFNWEDYSDITVKDSRQERVARSWASNEFVNATVVTLHTEIENREYDREFYLDEAGKLFRIDDTYLLTNDREIVRDGITAEYAEASGNMQVYLDRCIQTLREINQADTLYLETSSKQILQPSRIWIRVGADQLVSRYENGILTTTLEYGGSYFRRDKTYYGSYLIGDSKWYSTDSGADQQDYPWFLTMDWDSSEAFVLEAYATEYNEMIVLRVPERENTVQFYYDIETGELESIYFDGWNYTVSGTETAQRNLEMYYRQAAGLEAEPESQGARMCREALESLHSGSYTVVQSERTGAQAYARLQGFKDGEDQLICRTNTEQSYLRLDGKDYAKDADGWSETELRDFSGIEDWWLADLRWDPDRFFVHTYVFNGYIISVADDSLPQGFYTLEFTFDEQTGKLVNLTRSYDTGSPGDWTEHISILTIRYPEPDSISDYIRNYFSDTQE